MYTITLLLFLCSYLFGNDTTYAETEVVPKESYKEVDTVYGTGSRSYDVGESEQPDEWDDDGADAESFMGRCLLAGSDEPIESGGELLGRIFFYPIKLIYCSAAFGTGVSYAHLFAGDKEVNAFESPYFFGLTAGLGGTFTPGISGGVQFDVSGIFQVDGASHLAFRQRLGIRPSLVGIGADFQREVFVGDSSIGYQYDETDEYKLFLFSASSEVLIKPKGEQGAFYFTVGAGPVLRYESAQIHRTEEFNYIVSEFKESDWHWAPAVTAGFGRHKTAGNFKGFFELVYNGTFNANNKEVSLPYDNSAMSHAILMVWGLAF